MTLIEKNLKILKCPNSNSSLKIVDNILCSIDEQYKYRILDDNFIEILPNNPYKITSSSIWLKDNNFYLDQLSKNIDLNIEDKKIAWGIFEKMSIGYRNFINYEKEALNKKILNNNKRIAIDIAGGVGTHTFELAKHFDLVIHCDLWDTSIKYAYNKAKELKIDNILFIRCDYFNLPFCYNIADLIISIDSFDYYSVEDDKKVLGDCYNILGEKGMIFSDFHNKKGFFDNIRIHEYTKEEIIKLSSIFKNTEIIKFCRIPSRFLYVNMLKYIEKFLLFIPFVRWILIIKK